MASPLSMNPSNSPDVIDPGATIFGPGNFGYGTPGDGMAGGTYYSPYAGKPTTPADAPIMPYFNQIYNPSTMSLGNDMSKMLGNTSYDTQPLKNLEANAFNPNPSPWAQLQTQLSRQNTGQTLGNTVAQTAGGEAGAENNLAASGGLSSGARERIQETGNQAGIGAQQGVMNAGNQGLLQIGSQDAAQKQQEQMALPGMETQAYQASLEPVQMMGQAEAQDVAHDMGNIQALNNFNMQAYGNQASMYGANQTANATQNAAEYTANHSSFLMFTWGSWLCNAADEIVPFVDADKAHLVRLMRHTIKKHPREAQFYMREIHKLVARAKKNPNWQKRNVRFIRAVIQTIEKGQLERAYLFFFRHTFSLLERYWPECGHSVFKKYQEAA